MRDFPNCASRISEPMVVVIEWRLFQVSTLDPGRKAGAATGRGLVVHDERDRASRFECWSKSRVSTCRPLERGDEEAIMAITRLPGGKTGVSLESPDVARHLAR
jgi:hypothetical protein